MELYGTESSIAPSLLVCVFSLDWLTKRKYRISPDSSIKIKNLWLNITKKVLKLQMYMTQISSVHAVQMFFVKHQSLMFWIPLIVNLGIGIWCAVEEISSTLLKKDLMLACRVLSEYQYIDIHLSASIFWREEAVACSIENAHYNAIKAVFS